MHSNESSYSVKLCLGTWGYLQYIALPLQIQGSSRSRTGISLTKQKIQIYVLKPDRSNKNLSLERSLDLDLVSADWLCGGQAGNFQGWAIKQNDNESITTIRNKMIRMIMNQQQQLIDGNTKNCLPSLHDYQSIKQEKDNRGRKYQRHRVIWSWSS